NILLDAEELLRRWREHPAQRQELTALMEELTTLGLAAQMADLAQIDALCQVLLDLYGALEGDRLALRERFFDMVEEGHEALVGMIDQVAAGLQVTGQPELVAQLRALLDDPVELVLEAVPEAPDEPEVVEIELPAVETQAAI